MKFKIIYLGLALSLFLYACNDDNAEPESKNTTSAVTKETPVTAPRSIMVIKGQAVFEQKCTSCHGNDGTAGIGNAANLQISQMEKTVIVKTIGDGKGGMPPFKGQLSPEEITELSSYVSTLRK